MEISDEELVRRYQAGESYIAIAESVDTNPQRIRSRLVAAGVEIRSAGRRRVPVVADPDVVRRYEAGESMRAIAGSLGVDKLTVRSRLVSAGVRIRRRSAAGTGLGVSAEEVVRRYEAGESMRAIAGSLGVDKLTVRCRLLAAGVEIRPPGRHVPMVPDEELAGRYEAGETISAMAGSLGVDFSTVRSRLVAAGVRLRPKGRAGKPLGVSDEELVRRYRGGERINAIARSLGVDFGRVRSRLLAAGVEVRPAWVWGGRTPVVVADEGLVRRYRGGESITALARSLGVSFTTVRSRLVAAGVEIWSGGGSRGRVRTTARGTPFPPAYGAGRKSKVRNRDESEETMNEGSDQSGQSGLIRRRGMVAVYVQIADIIAKRIANGDLQPGDRVPSENELMQDFGVAQMTARRVHRELRERELAHTVQGEGSFVGLEGTPKADYLRPLYVQIADVIAKEIRAGGIA
ncbi:GntR family transcriptional regulator, partial [Acrocarpospora catenulata]|uniref:GntR family transcriptional regulator n=1 Tax=Acrocarpospora catenulata TaxID=2836182 RepID=UPI0027E1172C